ncbi:hypothetical protein GCM10028796_46900 [Ramlibacter monticola]
MCDDKSNERDKDSSHEEGGPSEAAQLVAMLQESALQERFARFQTYVAAVLPVFGQVDPALLYLAYLAGRKDGHHEASDHADMTVESTNVLMARAMACVANESGLTGEDLERSKQEFLAQRRADQPAKENVQ